MKEIISTLILDFQESQLDTGIPRQLDLQSVRGKGLCRNESSIREGADALRQQGPMTRHTTGMSRKRNAVGGDAAASEPMSYFVTDPEAAVCIGVRRCGKSTYLFQQMERLLASGVSRQNLLYLNFFDDRLHGLKQGGIGAVTEAYYSLYPEKKNVETVYCFFDEIQDIPGWEPFVDRLLRTEKCEVYITGSSARMLSKDVATQMRGRALSWELFPFSFREFLLGRGLQVPLHPSTRQRLLVAKAFEEFWEVGGFPEVLNLDRDLRVKTHQEYFHSVLFRDLVERHNIAHPRALKDLAHRLMDNIASLYSINALTGYLKSLGHKVPKATVSDWLEWFEDAYFLFTTRIFDPSLSRRNANPKKVYCVDHALSASVSSGIQANSGHHLENLVFVALRRNHPDIHYYRTRNGREVDFVVSDRGSGRRLIQACESMADSRTKKREVDALTEAMNELDLEDALIVTRREDEVLESEGKTIRVLPAWRFLLEESLPNSTQEVSP
jgi:hypothetical protein